MIKFDSVTFLYPGAKKPVFDDVHLTISKGESVCLMGANGSGKSTFAALLSGLLQPSSGRIRINSDKKHLLPVGILFQNPDNQFIALTVGKEIVFTLENLGVPVDEIDQKLSEVLEQFSISNLRNRLISELSGGEKQRVALASVMIHQPPILVLDEPDSFLDIEGQKSLEKSLAQLRERNSEFIQIRITQYPHVAQNYKRLIVFSDGEIIADDLPERILSNKDICVKSGLSYENQANFNFNFTGVNKEVIKSVQFDDVSFWYKSDRNLFDNLRVNIVRGDVLAVTGLSGTGKTSFGNLVCGLAEQISGKILYLDNTSQPVTLQDNRSKITGLFQQPERQFFMSNCLDELLFGPENLGIRLKYDDITSLFELVGLDRKSFASRDPLSLSVGEKRRLAFALVLALNPDFIVFDEPTCGLDPRGVGWFIKLIQYLKNKKLGIILITHDGYVISKTADKIIHLQGNGQYRIETKEMFFLRPDIADLLMFHR